MGISNHFARADEHFSRIPQLEGAILADAGDQCSVTIECTSSWCRFQAVFRTTLNYVLVFVGRMNVPQPQRAVLATREELLANSRMPTAIG